MQGPGSSISSKPENINFDRGSGSSDSSLEPQMSWNSIQTSVQNRVPEYRISPNAQWGLGESSSQHQGDQNERKKEHSWTFCPQATVKRPYEQSNVVSLDADDENPNVSQTTNGSYLRNSSPALPQDLNMVSGFVDEEDDECQLVECPSSYLPIGPSNEQMRTSLSTFNEREDRPGCSMDGRRMSCKRKALDVQTGQSSGVGSSHFYQNEERSQWHNIPDPQVAINETNLPEPRSEIGINNGSEQANPRLRLGVGAFVPPTPFSLTSSEISRRNFRLRSINGLYQQDPIPENPFSTDVVNANVSNSRYSSRLIRNPLDLNPPPVQNHLDLNPPPPVENRSLHGQSVLNIPSVRRHHHHSRWSGASSTRSSRATASAISEERGNNIPRSISEHPMFVPANETGSSSQNATNWNLHGGNNTIAGNVASTSRVGPSTGTNSSGPSWSHRNYPQYPRRLTEIVRRSLLSSEPGGQSSNHAMRSSSPALSQETAGSESHGHRFLNSRPGHLDASFGIPHSLRTLAAAGEGRGSASIMSEIRHVLDLMRRGEGLRFEDVMILDHSVLFGMADVHDRHREMRLDVDNMSYEELLALEERIGNVCTGLSEETIVSHLKQKKYVVSEINETEPCSICREEYSVGEDLGSLECGHDFHMDCIKQWLTHKNLCPICKTTGLNT